MVNEKCQCAVCGELYNRSYEKRHFASKKHLKFREPTSGREAPRELDQRSCPPKAPSLDTVSEGRVQGNRSGFPDIDEGNEESDGSVASDNATVDDYSEDGDDFLDGLSSDVWQDPEIMAQNLKAEKAKQAEMSKLAREEKRRMLEDDKLERARQKLQLQSKQDEQALTNEDVELLGRERHELIRRITQYKTEFKTELKSIRIPKKNITVELLNKIIEECECILDLGGAQAFVMDGLFQSIKVVEGVSSMTRNYDISGLADALKKDPHFNSLCRRLYIRYGSFSQVDPLYQAIFIVVTSAYVMRQKNIQRKAIDTFLDEPIPLPKAPENIVSI